ncbi:MAG: HD domain-containing protein [Bacteroidales bacterium]
MNKDVFFEIPEQVTQIILKYYQPGSLAYKYFYTHVVKVTELSIKIARNNPHLDLDMDYIIKGSMLHDIGIIKTNAPEIGCYGKLPYIAHTYPGRKFLNWKDWLILLLSANDMLVRDCP